MAKIINKTNRIQDWMDFIYCDNRLYWFDNEGKIVLRGGLRRIKERKLKRFENRYNHELNGYNLKLEDGLIVGIEE
ncbi:MAG: hypothetical protein ABFS10_06905 [Bacteroidota bacterium]